jgi:hypothetical protein
VRDGHLLDRFANPLGGCPRGIDIGAPHDQEQFFTAEAVGDVPGAQRPPYGGRDGAQDLVTGQVPQPIVVGLEVIDVAEGHCESVAAFTMDRLELGQVVGQRPAVAHPGERIPPRVLEELLVLAGQLLLAVGQADQRGPLPFEHLAQSALEQSPVDDESSAGEEHAGAKNEQCLVRGVLEARPDQRPEEQGEHDGGQQAAPLRRLVKLGHLLRGARREDTADGNGHQADDPQRVEQRGSRRIRLAEELSAPQREGHGLGTHPPRATGRAREREPASEPPTMAWSISIAAET